MDQVVAEENVDLPSQGASSAIEQQPYFFAPSTLKLVVMSVCTFGIYELYWFYRNWILIKEHTNQNMMPFWRAFFAPLWAYSCFEHIRLVSDKRGTAAPLSIGFLAVAYFVLQAMCRLPDPYWLISILSFAPIMPVNSVALAINQETVPQDQENSTFSTWNWVGVVGGGLFVVLAIIGAFLPEG